MPEQLSPEHIEELAARDARIAALRISIDLETDLRDNGPLNRIMLALREDADRAIDEFATVNPANHTAVMDLQARVYRFSIARQTFRAILADGQAAEADLLASDS